MAFDYKKEYKELYLPSEKPVVIRVPTINYVAVRGQGNPNDENGEYKRAIGILYAVAYTLKMSKLGKHALEGYFDYIVPPLEGLWRMHDGKSFDRARKCDLCWISMIRLPDFVKRQDLGWAVAEGSAKKKTDLSAAEYFTFDEGLCVQCMHIGGYDREPSTISAMHDFIEAQGYAFDLSDTRLHHEIYLSDPRKTEPEKLKTVIRIPIKLMK